MGISSLRLGNRVGQVKKQDKKKTSEAVTHWEYMTCLLRYIPQCWCPDNQGDFFLLFFFFFFYLAGHTAWGEATKCGTSISRVASQVDYPAPSLDQVLTER